MSRTIMTIDELSSADIFDSRDANARIEELEEEQERIADANAELEDGQEPEEFEDQEELEKLVTFRDEVGSIDWQYGITFIAEDYFKQYAEEYAEEIGAIGENTVWPRDCIDWDKAADELKMDYSSVELDNTTFYYNAQAHERDALMETKKPTVTRIIIERRPDPDPDTSMLGTYQDRCELYAVNRRDGILYGEFREVRNPDYEIDEDGDDNGEDEYIEEREALADGLSTDVARGTYQAWKPAQHLPHNPADWAHLEPEEIKDAFAMARNGFMKYGISPEITPDRGPAFWLDVLYAALDYERAEALNRGDWQYIGIRAVAVVERTDGGEDRFSSGGLWGIESDSGEEYFAETEKEELAELTKNLKQYRIMIPKNIEIEHAEVQ